MPKKSAKPHSKKSGAKPTAKKASFLDEISASDSDEIDIDSENVEVQIIEEKSQEPKKTLAKSSQARAVRKILAENLDDEFDDDLIDLSSSDGEEDDMDVDDDDEEATASRKKSRAPQKKRKRRSSVTQEGIDLDQLDNDEERDGNDYQDFSNLKLKEDHHKRSIWVLPDGKIFMETFAPNYREVYDFLISIAHPLARTRLMHQYKLNHGSLYAATSLGLETNHILKQLERFSKVELPSSVIDYITTYTERFGKATLVLKKGHYYIESYQRNVLEQLINDPEIAECTKSEIQEAIEDLGDSDLAFPTEMDVEEVSRQMDQMRTLQIAQQERMSAEPSANMDVDFLEEEIVPEVRRTVCSFEIDPSKFETVKRRCIEMDYPLLEEYDFANDTTSETIAISLKPTTVLRRYQEKCLSKLFAHGRVKSGIISLACGAGKSLVGVVASSTTKKKTLVLCTSTVSVQQWIHQFLLWSSVHHHNVVGFTSGGGSGKSRIHTAADLGGVLVTTYNMLSHSNKRSGYSAHVVRLIEQVEWGLVILDEVHVVPANTFRSVISKVKSHCKLGLSATLVREDDLIEHLLYLIGPKLYEANWLDLCRAGHIANVCCAEVWCPMTAEFFKEYVVAESRRGRSLYIMNPNKLRTCQHLINFHEARNDKILVFSDDVFALKTYATLLGKPYIYGSTPNSERMQLLSAFQYNSNAKTLFISKIGDNSIDLPEATVLIQISSHYGSRRQEAQRLGRILRPKARTLSGRSFDAYFYSLVSQDTKESYYSAKRQQFLIEQGYAFKIFKPMHNKPGVTVMATKDSQITLLRKVLAADIETLREMEDELDEKKMEILFDNLGSPKGESFMTPANTQVASTEYTYSRYQTGTTTLSGAGGLEYDEIEDMLDA
jgi:DNA excision repair protein ERCC-3